MPTLRDDQPATERSRKSKPSTLGGDWLRFSRGTRVAVRLASFFPFAFLIPSLGCHSKADSPLVIATTWPVADRSAIESIVRSNSAGSLSIEWVNLESGESLARSIDRRGGVDLVLGAPSWEFTKLERMGRLARFAAGDPVPWLSIRRPGSEPAAVRLAADPRDHQPVLNQARSVLEAEGWPRGYENLVRGVASFSSKRPTPGIGRNEPIEALGLIEEGVNLDRARRLVRLLVERGLAKSPESAARIEALADSLLADLLGSALVDASDELREAGRALVRFEHPSRAEKAIGERPPWPPASVLKLREGPNGEALLETLIEQVAPDPEAREWLRSSWSRPRRPIDGSLLLEIAGACEGRLANEPRFRGWLRGEWTAWSRQLYRRVARLAGGYVPS